MPSSNFFEPLEHRALHSATTAAPTNFAPASLAGLTLHCKVLQGTYPFGSLGKFDLHFNTTKMSYAISGAGIITSGAKYSYARTSIDHAIGLLGKDADGVASATFTFTSAHSGILITNPKSVTDLRKIKFSF